MQRLGILFLFALFNISTAEAQPIWQGGLPYDYCGFRQITVPLPALPPQIRDVAVVMRGLFNVGATIMPLVNETVSGDEQLSITVRVTIIDAANNSTSTSFVYDTGILPWQSSGGQPITFDFGPDKILDRHQLDLSGLGSQLFLQIDEVCYSHGNHNGNVAILEWEFDGFQVSILPR